MRRTLLFIPIYRCEAQIGRVLEKITPGLLAHLGEILVVDNRSPDASAARAQAALASLPIKSTLLQNEANVSLGGSIKVALNYALDHGYEYLMVLHGDDQADARDLLPALADGTAYDCDLCIGARFAQGSQLAGYSPLRILGNRAFNLLLGAITGRRIDDMIAGLNLYRLEMFKERWYMGFPDNLTFDAHLLLYAIHRAFQIRYVPISWREEDQLSNAKIFRQGWILLTLFLRYAVQGGRVFAPLLAKPPGVYGSAVLYKKE